MSLQQNLSRSLVLLVCVLAGCTGGDTSQDDRPPPSNAIETSSFDPYYQCDENAADRVLLVSFTVPNAFDGRDHFRIPFCRAEPEGMTFGGGGSSFSGTGPDGGANGFIGIESSTNTSLSVRVDLVWSSSKTTGEFNEVIVIPINKSGEKTFPKDRMIEWQFVTPGAENH